MERQLLSYLGSSFRIKQLKQTHALIITGYQTLISSFIGSLVNLSLLDYARKLFDEIPQTDPWLCNSFISAYTKKSLHREALDMFVLLHRTNSRISGFSVTPAVKSCSALFAFELGKQIHSLAVRCGLESNLYVQTSLMNFYAKSGNLDSARTVFSAIPGKDPTSYNCLISAYSKSGDALSARRLFDQMEERNIVSWNSIISCYAHNGDFPEAVRMFQLMQDSGLQPDERTLVSVLSVCAKSGDLELGLKVKDYIHVNHKLPNMIVATALVEMLLKCGAVDEARREFDRMEHRDIVAWGTMVTGYAQNGRPSEALELVELMKSMEIKPNDVTLPSILSAFAQLGSMEAGERLGNYIEREGFDSNVYVASSLLTMYSRCGQIEKAREVFSKTKDKDLVFWNSMMSGLALNGYAEEGIDLFMHMTNTGVKPNDATFVALLTACTHAGLVDLGLRFFDSMRTIHHINPKVEHYACIVDLLCKKGRLKDAYDYIRTMEVEPNVVIWGTLLSACRNHSNVELAEIAVRKLEVLEPENSGNYVLLSNIYANSGRWKEAGKVRDVMRGKKVQKTAAYSWIELEDGVHKFLVSDLSHPRSDEIYSIIEELAMQSISDETEIFRDLNS